MAELLHEEVSETYACSYLPSEQARLWSRVMVEVSSQELDTLLEQGVRRFGPHYFRPVCAACDACVSLRLPVESHSPSRSEKRVLKKARGVRVEVSSPTPHPSRLALYRKWHANREQERGWKDNDLSTESYAQQFCFPHPAAREFAYFEGDHLFAVAITDETPTAYSLVYCFYDPDRADLSPGKLNVLFSLQLARARRKKWVYLGYVVEGCRSLEYKAGFSPHELLVGRPSDSDTPRWAAIARSPLGDLARHDVPASALTRAR